MQKTVSRMGRRGYRRPLVSIRRRGGSDSAAKPEEVGGGMVWRRLSCPAIHHARKFRVLAAKQACAVVRRVVFMSNQIQSYFCECALCTGRENVKPRHCAPSRKPSARVYVR